MRSFQRNFSVSPSCPLLPLQLPSPMETHVWFVLPDEFKSVSLLNQYMELLSPCEKENVLTMRGDQLQKRALLARALVRTTIARCATISKSIIVTVPVASVLQEAIVAFWDQINNHVVDPRSFKFRKNVHGKPEIMMPQVALDASIKVSAAPGIRKVMDSEGGICESFGKRLLCCTFQDFHNSREGCNQFWVVESSDHPESLTNNWQFGLFELASSHYASICMEKDKTSDVAMRVPMRLTVRKTIPFVEDICISGTDAVVPIAGLIKQVIEASQYNQIQRGEKSGVYEINRKISLAELP
ncbi:4'-PHOSPHOPANTETHEINYL TRANSFERASE DOMAIN PROTEIN-RELATED [Salix koriyanagi]|uniref:holo-[acyl-carrier-protein] synthase n=1 Tax=Salix koriyanagi TaxID=2511006 RepID=A0A9Q0X475_9ROSI|nr:4'-PHOSPHOPANTETHEINYL TRANSFERASE DOMAIN PROTEIN-RELATED [Salix koriyanagi]